MTFTEEVQMHIKAGKDAQERGDTKAAQEHADFVKAALPFAVAEQIDLQ